MKELSFEQMERVEGGANSCSNAGNAVAMGGLILSGLALATGPVGWIAALSFGVSYASVWLCQSGYA